MRLSNVIAFRILLPRHLWRHALLNNYRGLFKVTDGVYQGRGESLANVTFVESDSGYLGPIEKVVESVAGYVTD